MEASGDARAKALHLLAAAGYNRKWQILAMPQEVLTQVLKPETAGQELTLVMHAVKSATQQGRNDNGAGAIVKELRTVSKRQHQQLRATKRHSKNSRECSSSSGTTDEGDFDASACLGKYGFPSLDSAHIVQYSVLKREVKAARTAAKPHRGKEPKKHLINQELTSHCPQWMQEKDKPKKGEMTHAASVACWWSRALSQLTAQAASGKETVPVQALLAEFLNVNCMAIEDTCKTVSQFEKDLWANAADRCQRRDSECVPEIDLQKIDENARSRARSAVAMMLAANKGTGKGKQQHGNDRFRSEWSDTGRAQSGYKPFARGAGLPTPPAPPPAYHRSVKL